MRRRRFDMNWEQLDESIQYQTDRLPTPSSTPRSAHDGPAFWQTPGIQVEARHSDGGQKSPYISQQAHSTPRNPETELRINPVFQEQDKINVELAQHTHHLSPNPNLPLPPVEPSRQLTSSPGLGIFPDSLQSSSRPRKLEQQTPSSVGSIRTPPSSGTHQRIGLGLNPDTSAMANPRRLSNGQRSLMGPPETPSRAVEASPLFFPTLQFSPDLYQFQTPGPASAPVFPQQRLFWDPSSHASDDATPRPYQDPFAHSQNGLINTFPPKISLQDSLQPASTLPEEQPYDLPVTSRVGVSGGGPYPYLDGATFPVPFTTSPRVPPQRLEDPSLFLSSPARRFGGVEASGGSQKHVREMPPYHHQIEESKREREFERARKAKAKRSSGIFPLANSSRRPVSPAHEIRPGLKRSLTHSGVGPRQPHLRNQSHVSFADSVSSAGNFSNHSGRGGRSSPLKTSIDSLPSTRPLSRHRTSLTFAIDEDGRAKTIVTQRPDPIDSFMDLDETSSGSEDDSMDDSDFQILHSQQNSFALPDRENFPLASQHYKSSLKAHSKNSSYSSTMASSNSAHHSSRTSSSNSGVKPKSSKPESLYGRSNLTRASQLGRSTTYDDLDALDDDNSAMEENAENGDAQYALRAIIRERPRSRSAHESNRPVSFTHFHSSPPVHHTSFAQFNASPTTITDPDIATPSTDRESYASNGGTRCVCSSSSPDGQFMIQCESCSKWLHINCVGIDGKNIPEVYICIYCSQTPMRHGRIREASRTSAIAPGSPLAHKSQRIR